MHATLWISLENMQNERSQTRKPHIVDSICKEMSRIGKFKDTES